MDAATAAERKRKSENDDPLGLSLGAIYSSNASSTPLAQLFHPNSTPSLPELSMFLSPSVASSPLPFLFQPSAGASTSRQPPLQAPEPPLAPSRPRTPPLPLRTFHTLPANPQLQLPNYPSPAAPGRSTRRRPNTSNSTRNAEPVNLDPPPFRWATEHLAVVHTLEYLRHNNITQIEGESQCKRCESRKMIVYDLEMKFKEVADYIIANRHDMDDRAPTVWTNPTFPDCQECGQRNCMRPIIPSEKHEINWLFLLLGQTLGCCTLEQLKYFCMHTKNHRTGAKDRVLYYTYLALCKQLCPQGPFDVSLGDGRLVHC